jgi:hypothetical protein
MINIFRDEFIFVKNSFEKNRGLITLENRVGVAVQLLTYLNRVEVLQPHEDHDFDLKLTNFENAVGNTSISMQEEWYREMMIHAHMKKNARYSYYREKLISLYNTRESGLPKYFIGGIISYYDGVLLCLAGQPKNATSHLEFAAINLSKKPKYTTNFLNQNFNVLLLGSGMKSGMECRQLLSKVISSGE